MEATLDRIRDSEAAKMQAKRQNHAHVPVVACAPLAAQLGETGIPVASAHLLATLIARLQARIDALEEAARNSGLPQLAKTAK